MFPPAQGTNLNIEALSGICGHVLLLRSSGTVDMLTFGNRSISIACWVVVFSPQVIENFRRGSADGLSLLFIIVWLAGDVFNILGAVLQGVLPTMVILAVYYTLADIVLLGQCFYYRGFTLSDAPTKSLVDDDDDPAEDEPLLSRTDSYTNGYTHHGATDHDHDRTRSTSSFRHHLTRVDGTHLSPATPLLPAPATADPPAAHHLTPTSTAQTILFNCVAIVLVCAAGAFGWWLSSRHTSRHDAHAHPQHPRHPAALRFDVWGQFFGYLCAALYLGSRVPQILLNWRRKSTEGVSLLFFLFACIGNLTYVMSILAYAPPECGGSVECRPGEKAALYGRYVLVNTSWLIGSLGTLFLDLGIFVQFFMYRSPPPPSPSPSEGGLDGRAEGARRGRSPDER